MSAAHHHSGWANAVHAMLPSPFLSDLAKAVTNDGSDDGASRYLLNLAIRFLHDAGQRHDPIAAFDFACWDFESIGNAWSMMGKMADEIDVDRSVTVTLARFIADRLPSVWASPPWEHHPALTRALVLADRAHDLIGLFAVGLKPNGSKDPFALRRAANHWLKQVVFPITAYDRDAPIASMVAA